MSCGTGPEPRVWGYSHQPPSLQPNYLEGQKHIEVRSLILDVRFPCTEFCLCHVLDTEFAQGVTGWRWNEMKWNDVGKAFNMRPGQSEQSIHLTSIRKSCYKSHSEFSSLYFRWMCQDPWSTRIISYVDLERKYLSHTRQHSSVLIYVILSREVSQVKILSQAVDSRAKVFYLPCYAPCPCFCVCGQVWNKTNLSA